MLTEIATFWQGSMWSDDELNVRQELTSAASRTCNQRPEGEVYQSPACIYKPETGGRGLSITGMYIQRHVADLGDGHVGCAEVPTLLGAARVAVHHTDSRCTCAQREVYQSPACAYKHRQHQSERDLSIAGMYISSTYCHRSTARGSVAWWLQLPPASEAARPPLTPPRIPDVSIENQGQIHIFSSKMPGIVGIAGNTGEAGDLPALRCFYYKINILQ